jgi:predicted Rdx family selenoprotein
MPPHSEGSQVDLGLFDRFRGRRSRRADGRDPAADLNYLRQWVADHVGVEAFVEPKTTVTEVTVVLVDADGVWTRRRAGGYSGARKLSDRLHIPVYDVQKVGYPQRMRDHDARQRILRDREMRRELEEG